MDKPWSYPSAAKLCRQWELTPNKNFGQNFLDKSEIIKKILAPFALGSRTTVLEIGPGLGHLSYAILSQGATLISLEIDQRLEGALQELAQEFPGFTVLWGDALSRDWEEFSPIEQELYCIANVPYYISSDILLKALLELWEAKAIALLLQREVAEKFAAKAGSKLYGPLAALAGLYGELKLGAPIPAQAFYPPPTIESRVLYLTKWQEPLAEPFRAEREAFWCFLQGVFATRRKTMRNNLRAFLTSEKEIIDVDTALLELAKDPKLDLGLRPEMFSAKQLWYIFKSLDQINV